MSEVGLARESIVKLSSCQRSAFGGGVQVRSRSRIATTVQPSDTKISIVGFSARTYDRGDSAATNTTHSISGRARLARDWSRHGQPIETT